MIIKIKPKVIRSWKGDIIKYDLNSFFFKKKIRDFYFTEIEKNITKDWKFKNKQTVLIVTKGEVKIEFIKNNNKKYKVFKSKNKEIIIIPRKTKFRFSAPKEKSQMISFLNDIY